LKVIVWRYIRLIECSTWSCKVVDNIAADRTEWLTDSLMEKFEDANDCIAFCLGL